MSISSSLASAAEVLTHASINTLHSVYCYTACMC